MKSLIIIDVQTGLTEKKKLYNDNNFIDTVNNAIMDYREAEGIIVFVQHNNKLLPSGSADWQLDERLDYRPGDPVFQKEEGNAFSNKMLVEFLRDKMVSQVVICGLVSHGCIRHSCIGALDEKFEVKLLSGGHTNWNREAVKKICETEEELVKIGVKITTS